MHLQNLHVPSSSLKLKAFSEQSSLVGDRRLLSASLCCETSCGVVVLCLFFMPCSSRTGEDGWNVEEWKAMMMEVLVVHCEEHPFIPVPLELCSPSASCLHFSVASSAVDLRARLCLWIEHEAGNYRGR